MANVIYPTTALHVVGAVDCTLLAREEAASPLVASFLDIVEAQAENALLMAEALGFLEKMHGGTSFRPRGLLAQLLVSCKPPQRPAIFRLALEQFEPFIMFGYRLAQAHSAQDAARAVKTIFNLTAHRQEIASTLTDLGTFSNSLRLEAGGLLVPKADPEDDYLSVTAEVLDDRQSATIFIARRVGTQATNWVDRANVLDHLVTAYQRAAAARNDSRPPILHAANAIESFLEQVGGHFAVNMTGATGINAKAERLYQSNPRRITTKHLNLLRYLGHVRNAADHGVDTETGQTWEITEGAAVEYVHVAMTAVASIVSYIHNHFRI